MLNRDFSNSTLNIIRATRPNIEAPAQQDYIGMIQQAGKDFNEGMLTKQMIDEHPEDKARIRQMGGSAYADMLKEDELRAEQRQQQLDDIAAQRDFQREMMDAQLKNSFALENMRHNNAMGLAQYKAGLAAQNGGNGQAPLNPFDKKRIEKAASDMDANITRAQEMKATFEQANNALKNINTGTPFAMLTKNRPLFSNADEEAFDSAAAKSIDMVRKAGTGPMTDADARRYEKASIDRGKSKEANQLLIDSGMIAADNAIAREELRADWVANGGSLSDFDREWHGYLNSNPIFGKDGKINKGRQDAFNWFYNPEQRQQPSLANYQAPQNDDPLGLR